MDIRQLEYILTIAEEKSLSSAAEKLYLSSSALSQHVTKLESELSATLFLKKKSGWIPTEAGRIYMDMAREILSTQKKAYARISDLAGSRTGRFKVGVTAGRGTQMFSEIFPKFQKKYPGFTVQLFEGTVLEISKKIEDGTVDIGFLTSGMEFPNIHNRFQTKENIYLAIPVSDPIVKKYRAGKPGENTIDLRLLSDAGFLLGDENTTLRRLVDGIFQELRIQPKIIFETPSLQTLNRLSESGYGPAFVPAYYAGKSKKVIYFKTRPMLSWDLVASYEREHYLTQAEEYFIALATEYLKGKVRE